MKKVIFSSATTITLVMFCMAHSWAQSTTNSETNDEANNEANDESNYSETIEQIASAIEEQYPIESKAHSIASHLRNAAGDAALMSPVDDAAFIESVNAALWDAAHDLHLRVQSEAELQARMSARGSRTPRMRRVVVPDGGSADTEASAGGPVGVRRAEMSAPDSDAMGTTKISAEMLNEETGLITISSGIYNNRDLFTDVLSSISTAKNVIVDLRATPGGTQRGVQYFTSQFYSEPTHLSSHIERGFDEPQELWSVDTPVSAEFAEKNIYVLTSHRTGSGAEALSYALKETRGAVLIGEKTAGAGNAGAFMSVGSGMSLFLPISQTISPVTGEPWEGTGVRPHITTIAGSALDVALSTIAKGALPGDEGFGQSDADLAAAIDAYVLGLSASDEFSGAVLVAKDGKVLSSTSVGDADKASGRKNTADTPINLGSTNKMFTGVAIAQLVEKGLLDWQDKVGKYLPDYPNPVVRDSVTIDQLLTHMSGVEAFADQDDFERYRQVTTVAGLMDVISDNPLGFEPGTRYKYSNAGPWILGRIIEVVTGQDYYDYIQANILDPAGMASTGFFRKDDTKADIARGYLKPQQGPRRKGQPMEKASGNEAWQPNTDMIGLRGSPSGSAYSSTNDMLKFANALNQNILITADSFKTLTTPRSGENAKDYGYLFRINETNGFRYWGHNGGGPGIQASFMHISALGYTIVVLSNYGSAAMPVSEQIQELLTTSSEG